MKTRTLMLLASALILSSAAFAQQINDQRIEQREQNQQNRIAAGEASGSLTPAEASRLEKKEANFDKKEVRAEADGKLTPKERMRLERDQDRLSRDIYRQKHDAQTDREGRGVVDRREANQQRRIAAGERNGSLTPAEAARLEHQQARFERQENRYRASGGGLSMAERQRLNREQNQMSRNIYRKKHNARTGQ